MLSLPGVNSSGYTKRITLSSYAFLGYALGNITGPFMVKTGEVPAYRSVFIADMICIALQCKQPIPVFPPLLGRSTETEC